MVNLTSKIVIDDTIAAISTPNGRGGIGIIRVSGNKVYQLIKILIDKKLQDRKATLVTIYNSQRKILDKCIVIKFNAPNSYTGEDILEIHAHGSTVTLDLILQEILQTELSIRSAEPGEFTKRAYLNGKMNLLEAEAVMDIIEANSVQAARSAARSLAGEFVQTIDHIKKLLIDVRKYIEVSLDFSEEEVDLIPQKEIKVKLYNLLEQFNKITQATKNGIKLQDGFTIVLCGKPNAGKSTTLNNLAQQDVAIVTETPGTTRDLITTNILIDNFPFKLVDTAGIRESNDVIEVEGIKRALAAVNEADLILMIVDISSYSHFIDDNSLIEQIHQDITKNHIIKDITLNNRCIVVLNKIDKFKLKTFNANIENISYIGISAQKDIGIIGLKEMIKEIVGYKNVSENSFTARRRHLDGLMKAKEFVQKTIDLLVIFDLTLMAEELRHSQNEISKITGEFTNEDLLGEIFSNFCIGK